MSASKLKSLYSPVASLLLVALLSSSVLADSIYLNITGPNGAKSKSIKVLALHMARGPEIATPLSGDQMHGAKGTDRYPSIELTIEVKAENNFINSIYQGKGLSQVKIVAFKPTSNSTMAGAGEEQPYYTIDLRDALITKIEFGTQRNADGSSIPTETIDLTYKDLTETFTQGSKGAIDDWQEPV